MNEQPKWEWTSPDPIITNGKAIFLKIDKATAYIGGLIIFLFFSINTWALYQSFSRIGEVVNRLNANSIEIKVHEQSLSRIQAEQDNQQEKIVEFYRSYGGILDDLKNGKR